MRTINGAADADLALAEMTEGELQIGAAAEMSSEEVLKHLESAQALANTAEEAIEQVLAATPQKRAAEMIKDALEYLGPDANAEQRAHVADHIRSFSFRAADFLMRADNHGLETAISTFWNGVRYADNLATPKPPRERGDSLRQAAKCSRSVAYRS